MKLNKTKLAGIISLLCSTSTMAAQVDIVQGISDNNSFGPFVSAVSGDANPGTGMMVLATFTQKFAQPFAYDIGAPWTYNEYCLYDSDICEMLWKGTKSDLSDSLYAWRRNIMNTQGNKNYPYVYESESTSRVSDLDPNTPSDSETPNVQPLKLNTTNSLDKSIKVTAINSDNDKVGYATSTGSITRRGFYNDAELSPVDFNPGSEPSSPRGDKGGFSSAYDFSAVDVTKKGDSISYHKKVAVGQASVAWARDVNRFDYCFNWTISDDRYDYDDLFYCPGFDLQASYWEITGTDIVTAKSFVGDWLGSGGSPIYLANAYAINTSGFAVGFTTDKIHDATNGGRSRAALFVPTVESTDTLTYDRIHISRPLTETGSDHDDIIRDTVAVDITDSVYVAGTPGSPATFKSVTEDGGIATDNPEQAFIVVGNRTFNQPKNRSYATEFFTYNVLDGSVRYPLTDTPIKGANSRVNKINNDGIAVGWRDSRGEVNPTYQGSPRFQSAFLYDFKKDKTAYLDDMYCRTQQANSKDVTIRLTNAISISEDISGDDSGKYIIVANGYDYKNPENYKNKTGSTPVVVTMTYSDDDFYDATNAAVCPTAENESYERQGAGMGWFLLLPLTILFRRRFNG